MQNAKGNWIHPRINKAVWKLIEVKGGNLATREYEAREAARNTRESSRTIDSWIFCELWQWIYFII